VRQTTKMEVYKKVIRTEDLEWHHTESEISSMKENEEFKTKVVSKVVRTLCQDLVRCIYEYAGYDIGWTLAKYLGRNYRRVFDEKICPLIKEIKPIRFMYVSSGEVFELSKHLSLGTIYYSFNDKYAIYHPHPLLTHILSYTYLSHYNPDIVPFTIVGRIKRTSNLRESIPIPKDIHIQYKLSSDNVRNVHLDNLSLPFVYNPPINLQRVIGLFKDYTNGYYRYERHYIFEKSSNIRIEDITIRFPHILFESLKFRVNILNIYPRVLTNKNQPFFEEAIAKVIAMTILYCRSDEEHTLVYKDRDEKRLRITSTSHSINNQYYELKCIIRGIISPRIAYLIHKYGKIEEFYKIEQLLEKKIS